MEADFEHADQPDDNQPEEVKDGVDNVDQGSGLKGMYKGLTSADISLDVDEEDYVAAQIEEKKGPYQRHDDGIDLFQELFYIFLW